MEILNKAIPRDRLMGQQAERERDRERERERKQEQNITESLRRFLTLPNSVGNYMLQSGAAEQMSCMCDFHSIHTGIKICLNSHLSSIEPKCF